MCSSLGRPCSALVSRMHATQEGVLCRTHGQSSPIRHKSPDLSTEMGVGVKVQVRAQAEVGYRATGVPGTAVLKLTSKDPSF